jgi:uncharacterized membrane protein
MTKEALAHVESLNVMLWIVLALLVVGAFVALVVLAVREIIVTERRRDAEYGPPHRDPDRAVREDPAVHIARERYSRGEISAEEFDHIVLRLRGYH